MPDSNNSPPGGDGWKSGDSHAHQTVSKSRSPLKLLAIWIRPFTRLHQIPVFKRVAFYLAVMALYTLFVDFINIKEADFTKQFKDLGNAAYLGVIFGLLLVFRTNSAYERWWEGRKLWGQLVNESRNICLKARFYVKIPSQQKVRMGEQVVSFAFALKHHLRDTVPSKNLPGIEPISKIPPGRHLPAHVAGRTYETLQHWLEQGYINDFKLLMFDGHVKSFMDICGACERIKKTPLAISYRAFMRQGIALNLVILPWIIVPNLSMIFAMPLILVASYFLIGLELIAEDIEDPFGEEGDDLPLDNICTTIQKSVSEILPVDTEQKFTTSVTVPQFDPLKYTASVKTLKADPLKEDQS